MASTGTWDGPFQPNTLTYNLTVAPGDDGIYLTATTRDPNASLTIGGVAVVSGTPSSLLALPVGQRKIIPVIVTAEDGTTRRYVVSVFRPLLSGDATLSALTPSAGSLSPDFDPGTADYTLTVPHGVAAVHFVPEVNDAAAEVSVDGDVVASGAPSADVPLVAGATRLVVFDVTAEDGTTMNYTVAVTRAAASSDAALSDLRISPGSLAFDPARTDYDVALAREVHTVTLTPTPRDPDAQVKVNGMPVSSGTASPPITLLGGSNTIITVSVTAADGVATEDYRITVISGRPGKLVPIVRFTSTAPADAAVGDSYEVKATYVLPSMRSRPPPNAAQTAALSLDYAIDPASGGACSIDGQRVRFLAEGHCDIIASLAESANYAAASARQRVTIGASPLTPPDHDPQLPAMVEDQVRTVHQFNILQMQNVQNRLTSLHDPLLPGFDPRVSLSLDNRPIGNVLAAFVAPEGGTAEEARSSGAAAIGRLAPASADFTPTEPQRVRFWTAGKLDFGFDETRGHTPSHFIGADLSAGADTELAKGLLGGIAIGRNGNDTDFDGDGSRSRARGYSGSLYASWQVRPGLFIDGLAGFGTGKLDLHRHIEEDDLFAVSDRDYRATFGSLSLSDNLVRGPLTISPSATLELSHIALSAASETGGGRSDLTFHRVQSLSVKGTAALDLSYDLKIDHTIFRPRASIGYRREFAADYVQRLNYVAEPSALYDIAGNSGVGGELLAGTGVSIMPDDKTLIDIGIAGAFADAARTVSVRAELSRRF